MSEFQIEVVKLGPINNLENADSLEITDVHGGYPCIIKKGSFKEGDLAVYIPVDSMVPVTNPLFAFLEKNAKYDGYARIKALRLRGTFSMGLLVPAPDGSKVGDNLQEALQIKKYIPPTEMDEQEDDSYVTKKKYPRYRKIANRYLPKWLIKFIWTKNKKVSFGISDYDIDGLRKYKSLLLDGIEVVISEKVHGCLNSSAVIWMADGTRKKIPKVQVGDEVLGVDENGIVQATKVLNVFNNKTGKEWYRFEINAEHAGRGNFVRVVSTTADHKFFNPVSKKYVRADQLKEHDPVLIMRSDQDLTPIQKSTLVGKVLGDGFVTKQHEKSASVDFCHTENDIDYVFWTRQALGSLCEQIQITKQISGYGSTMYRTRTAQRFEIRQLFSNWFDDNGKKIVPPEIVEMLDPISLAFWYMDKGSLSHHIGQEDRACFATNGFDYNSCLNLQKALLKFNIESTVFDSKGWRIRLNSDNSEKLFLIIAPYIPPCMQRKLPARYKGHEVWLPKEKEYKPSAISSFISSISINNKKSTRFDLETETHNYFAGGVLVHNCNARFSYRKSSLFSKGRFYIGSHHSWGRDKDSNWGIVATKYSLEKIMKQHPNIILYGEVYGRKIQDLTYGLNDIDLLVFDIQDIKTKKYLPYDDLVNFCQKYNLPMVPELYRGPWKPELVSLAEGNTTINNAGHVREGIVIKTIQGRTILKLHGEGYLTRKEKKI